MTKKTIRIRQTDAPFLQPIQSNRYLEINDDWFFFTREKDLLGPYRSHLIAEHAVMVYIDKMVRINNHKPSPDTESAERGMANSQIKSEIKSGIKGGIKNKIKGDVKQDKKSNVLYFKHPNWNI